MYRLGFGEFWGEYVFCVGTLDAFRQPDFEEILDDALACCYYYHGASTAEEITHSGCCCLICHQSGLYWRERPSDGTEESKAIKSIVRAPPNPNAPGNMNVKCFHAAVERSKVAINTEPII